MDIYALVLESDNTGGEYLSVYKLVDGINLMSDNFHKQYLWQYHDIMLQKEEALQAQTYCAFFFENEHIAAFLPVLDSHFSGIMPSGTIERLFECSII